MKTTRIIAAALRLVLGLSLLTLFTWQYAANAASRTWSGLGANAFWDNTNNWVGHVRPAGTDDVVFASATAQMATVNNWIGGLHSLSFGVGGYSISESSLVLTNGITATNTTGQNVIAGNIVLGANQSFTNLNAGASLALVGLDLHGHGATFRGAGTNLIANVILDSTGGGSLTNAGTGVFRLEGTNSSFTGASVLTAGTNIINSFHRRSPITWTAGTLGGTGTLGSVTASGASAKQLAPGHLGGGGMNVSNLVLNSSVTVIAQINGTNIPTDYGRVSITGGGSSHLGSAALSLSFAPNFSPVVGTSFHLFLTDPSTLLLDTFTNLPEGSTVTNNGIVCQVSYNFGHGVILTVSDVLTSGSRSWDGGGTNNLWSNRTNWSSNVAPVQGNDLLFTALSGNPPMLQRTNVNDLPADSTFGLLKITVPPSVTLNLNLSGNSFRLNDGLSVVSSTFDLSGAGSLVISNDIAINNSQVFSNNVDAELYLAGDVALGANTLSANCRANTDIFFDGSIAGTGGLEIHGGSGGNARIHLRGSNNITGGIETTNCFLFAEHAQALGRPPRGRCV